MRCSWRWAFWAAAISFFYAWNIYIWNITIIQNVCSYLWCYLVSLKIGGINVNTLYLSGGKDRSFQLQSSFSCYIAREKHVCLTSVFSKRTLVPLRTFSLELDESTDINNTAQLAIFINFWSWRRVYAIDADEWFNTTDRNIFKPTMDCAMVMNLNLSHLVAGTTDETPTSRIVQHCKDAGFQQNIGKIHCIIHRKFRVPNQWNLKTLWTQSLPMSYDSLFKFETANFKLFLMKLLWLITTWFTLPRCDGWAKGSMLMRVFKLRNEIRKFLHLRNLRNAAFFFDKKWISKLTFLADMNISSERARQKPSGPLRTSL